jgi:BMFP domain-containing protein YqiC
MIVNRRSFISGLAALVAAPAIVRAGSLMPVKQMIEVPEPGRLFRITSVVTSSHGYSDITAHEILSKVVKDWTVYGDEVQPLLRSMLDEQVTRLDFSTSLGFDVGDVITVDTGAPINKLF